MRLRIALQIALLYILMLFATHASSQSTAPVISDAAIASAK
jgi:hypothetical protein